LKSSALSIAAGILFQICLLFPYNAGAASLEPLGMQDAELLAKNTAEFRIGFSYSDDLHNLFQSEDRDRRLAELPSLTLTLGLGNRVEGQLDYSYLFLQEDGQGNKWGSGDLTLALKVRLWRESMHIPAIALRLSTKLPNADDKDDFGTDEADIFLDFLATRNFPDFSIYLNLGLAILGDPHNGQDDSVQYALGMRIPLLDETLDALFSLEGMEGGSSLNSRGAFRAGIQLPVGRFMWDFGGSIGYVSKSEDWGLRTGLSFPFSLSDAW
jgi:hypothetical protein